MAITLNGSTGIDTPAIETDSLVIPTQVINGITVGNGGGSVATNTAVGASALATNTSSGFTTAVGYQAGNLNTVAAGAFFGAYAGATTSTGTNNTAIGTAALRYNTTGANNTAIGRQALQENTTASQNTAVGFQAGYKNTTGTENCVLGYQALYENTTGSYNTAFGRSAGQSNVSDNYNTFIGYAAGIQTGGGASNTFIGAEAGYYVSSGDKNTIIGRYTGNQGGLDIRTASNYIVLSDGDGNPRMFFDGNGWGHVPTMLTTALAANAYFDNTNSNRFYRSTSSIRYKKNVQDATHGLEELLKLRPVTYQGIGDNDSNITIGGLIAEEVDAIGLKEFVQYNQDKTPEALAYGNMVSLCIKAIQELKATVDLQSTEIASLKAQLNNGV